MATINTLSSSVKQIQNEQRAYKSEQRRLASTVLAYKATLTVNSRIQSTNAHLWVNGAAPQSFISNLSITYSGISRTFYEALPTMDGNRIGWLLAFYSGDASVKQVTFTVISNQEVSLDFEQ